jgi:hypothetical protein
MTDKSVVIRRQRRPPKYVKAYVKRGKTDAGDAAAIFD